MDRTSETLPGQTSGDPTGRWLGVAVKPPETPPSFSGWGSVGRQLPQNGESGYGLGEIEEPGGELISRGPCAPDLGASGARGRALPATAPQVASEPRAPSPERQEVWRLGSGAEGVGSGVRGTRSCAEVIGKPVFPLDLVREPLGIPAAGAGAAGGRLRGGARGGALSPGVFAGPAVPGGQQPERGRDFLQPHGTSGSERVVPSVNL